MAAYWEDASESYYAPLIPARQGPHPAAKRASIGGLLVSGVAIATLTKIGALPPLLPPHAGAFGFACGMRSLCTISSMHAARCICNQQL
jgi:hypothetical protein